MLDDLRYIHERDSADALGLAEKEWQQLKHVFKVENPKPEVKSPISNIVVAGMGGSALAATIVTSWPQTLVPFEVVRDYDLPPAVGKQTLFIASSYSGNTEETLAALDEAEARGCQIMVIASGGALAARSEEKRYPLYKIPDGLQPRMAVFYNLAALVQLLEMVGLTEVGKVEELNKAADWLGAQVTQWRPDSATKNNRAKQIAQELMGKSVVVYGGSKMYPAAYKWKINFNENAKHIAWCNQFPEFNHNEMLGWTKQPVDKPYAVIELHSNLENPRIQKRFKVTERLLSGLRPEPITIDAEGKTLLQQLLWTIMLGDFTSLYLALLSNLDPTPVELIEKFKKALTE